ncbi:MAG TPA: hypothetical protein VLL05_19395 [Terriglobales bacterium]|nr:hypothetical protein [Terriglobales bacterium]
MKIKLDRIISIATLSVSVVALVLVLKRPQPVAPAMPSPAVAANAQSFQNKIEQLEQARAQGQSGAEVRLNAQEVAAAIAQASGALSSPVTGDATAPSAGTNSGGSLTGDLGAGEPNVKDYQVNFEGDVAKGQFLTHIAGKDVWVTLEGHLGSKDGYATFDPTKIKIGDLEVPVSLVNDQLQKRLAEQRDRLKLPDNVGGLRVENGEVVVSNK